MPKLTTGPNYLVRMYGRTDGRTDPNCRKASFLKKTLVMILYLLECYDLDNVSSIKN